MSKEAFFLVVFWCVGMALALAFGRAVDWVWGALKRKAADTAGKARKAAERHRKRRLGAGEKGRR